MAYLSDQNNIIKTDYNINSCGFDEVYLNNLKEGELLVSYQPFYIQNSDGKLAGIDGHFNTLYIVKDSQVLKTFNMTWHSDCRPVLLNNQFKKEFIVPTFIIPVQNYLIPSFIILISILFFKIIKKK